MTSPYTYENSDFDLNVQQNISQFFVLQHKIIFVHGLLYRRRHVWYQLVDNHPNDEKDVLEPDKEKDPRQVGETKVKGSSQVTIHGKEGAVGGDGHGRGDTEGVVPRANVPDPTRCRFSGETAQLPGIHPNLNQVVTQGQEGRKRVHRRKEEDTCKKKTN